jgi:hypothetical protein
MEGDFVFQLGLTATSMLLALASSMTSRRYLELHDSYARAGFGLIALAVLGQLLVLALEATLELPPALLLATTLGFCIAVLWRRMSSKRMRAAVQYSMVAAHSIPAAAQRVSLHERQPAVLSDLANRRVSALSRRI